MSKLSLQDSGAEGGSFGHDDDEADDEQSDWHESGGQGNVDQGFNMDLRLSKRKIKHELSHFLCSEFFM